MLWLVGDMFFLQHTSSTKKPQVLSERGRGGGGGGGAHPLHLPPRSASARVVQNLSPKSRKKSMMVYYILHRMTPDYFKLNFAFRIPTVEY